MLVPWAVVIARLVPQVRVRRLASEGLDRGLVVGRWELEGCAFGRIHRAFIPTGAGGIGDEKGQVGDPARMDGVGDGGDADRGVGSGGGPTGRGGGREPGGSGGGERPDGGTDEPV